MNLREFAEQVVFGTTLADKLLVPGELPGNLTEEVRRGPNVDSLATPGRPVGMQMQYGPGGNAQPPSDDRLENEQARGQLLHFLANHELLATELMALVLLKFPDAPAAFRQGVFATLQEEQAHMRMYLRRMQECGVEFGSFPLNGQFWRVVEPELDRVIDLSFLWHWPSGETKPSYLGWTRPVVTGGRRYAGTRLVKALTDCDANLKRFVLAERRARMQVVAEWLESRLAEELSTRNFSGYFGVDALVCQDASGEFKVKPLVELNPRMTMGHVALSLEKGLAPGVDADFRILTMAEWQELHQLLESIPLEQSRDGHWKSGVIRLGEVDENTKLVPVLLVGDQAIARVRN